MKINISKKQYIQLIRAVELSGGMTGLLKDMVSDEYEDVYKQHQELEQYLFQFGQAMGLEDLFETFEKTGGLYLTEEAAEEIDAISSEYDGYIFWSDLEVRLGKRDFMRSMTAADKKEIQERDGWLPERIHELYEKYAKEFEEHGIERLEINDDEKNQK